MSDESDGRGQSTIQFPYVDLEGAIEVARSVLDRGGVPLERDQLAAAMGVALGSGNFSIKLGAARMFGLLENAAGKYQLTPLGFEILDPSREKAAMATAFLNVPLYKRVYDDFRGRQLPPRPHGLEQAFQNFGVAPKQKDKARHVFDRSARQAGYFQNGDDRLVAPVVAGAGAGQVAKTEPEIEVRLPPPPPPPPTKSYHPFVEGLLATLPPVADLPERTNWSIEDRTRWLQAAANIFDLIYAGGDRGTVEVAANPVRPKAEGP